MSCGGDDLRADFYLLGEVDFDRTLGLQRRLAYEVGETGDFRLVILLCHHRDLITVGRSGSRAHIRFTNEQLQRHGVKVQWVGRGGGCIPHMPGQLAVYPIVPLRAAGWTVGQYAARLQNAIRMAIERFNVHTAVLKERFGVWGQSGLLAAVGVAVRNWTTHHGVYLNVHPPMTLFHHVHTAGSVPRGEKATMSSLLAERRVAARMANVRTAVIESLVESFGCSRYHVHAAHPCLRPPQGAAGEQCTNL